MLAPPFRLPPPPEPPPVTSLPDGMQHPFTANVEPDRPDTVENDATSPCRQSCDILNKRPGDRPRERVLPGITGLNAIRAATASSNRCHHLRDVHHERLE